MAATKIEWTDETWNPVTGCTKISPGCKHCYAERMSMRLQAMGNPNYHSAFDLTLQPHMLDHPLHPYTSGLLAALPRPEMRGRHFTQIPGAAPVPIDLPRECGFRPRCPRATEECRSKISMRELRPNHFARCIHPQVEGA